MLKASVRSMALTVGALVLSTEMAGAAPPAPGRAGLLWPDLSIAGDRGGPYDGWAPAPFPAGPHPSYGWYRAYLGGYGPYPGWYGGPGPYRGWYGPGWGRSGPRTGPYGPGSGWYGLYWGW